MIEIGSGSDVLEDVCEGWVEVEEVRAALLDRQLRPGLGPELGEQTSWTVRGGGTVRGFGGWKLVQEILGSRLRDRLGSHL